MTHACENITLPQTSFAGGKNSKDWKINQSDPCDNIISQREELHPRSQPSKQVK